MFKRLFVKFTRPLNSVVRPCRVENRSLLNFGRPSRNSKSATKRARLLLFIGLLQACGGIPLTSLPQLIGLQNDLLKADPAEFMLAIQTDDRLVPPPDAVPTLILKIDPAKPGAFEPVDKQLPMEFTIAAAGTLGLSAPAAGRKWLVYRLSRSSQTELKDLQSHFKTLKKDYRGATLGVGIAQDGIAAKDPALAGTVWDSWLQLSRKDGFFELWSGTVGDLLAQAQHPAGVK